MRSRQDFRTPTFSTRSLKCVCFLPENETKEKNTVLRWSTKSARQCFTCRLELFLSRSGEMLSPTALWNSIDSYPKLSTIKVASFKGRSTGHEVVGSNPDSNSSQARHWALDWTGPRSNSNVFAIWVKQGEQISWAKTKYFQCSF